MKLKLNKFITFFCKRFSLRCSIDCVYAAQLCRTTTVQTVVQTVCAIQQQTNKQKIKVLKLKFENLMTSLWWVREREINQLRIRES